MTGASIPFLWLGATFLGISLACFLSGREKLSLLFLAAGALSLCTFSALLDPFLNLWDERFHALVAKNLLHHPLKPTLYDDPVVPMAYDRWDRYQVWLHKQPLFLWQIALAFKLFGVNEIALRIPSVLQGTLVVLMTYRIGKLLINSGSGYYAAFLFSTSFYLLGLISGRQSLDHNDVSFLFYITCSIWAFSEYQASGNRKWILLIGAFSGCAVLCKWLTGLFIFFPWFICIVQDRPFPWRKYIDLLLAIAVSVLVFLPWQVLILSWYPAEARQAYHLNSLHFTQVIKPHGGDYWFYADTFRLLYGKVVPWIIIPGIVILWKRMGNRKTFYALFLAAPIVVYVFFTIAKTKMQSYPYIISPLVYMAIGALVYFLVTRVRQLQYSNRLLTCLILASVVCLGWFNLNYPQIKMNHTLDTGQNSYSGMLTQNRRIFYSLRGTLPEHTVLFNVKGRHYIECMFYTGFPAYNFIPTLDQYLAVKQSGRRIAVFTGDNAGLPGYLSADPSVIVLPQIIRGYD
jgi:4-amino-4-deoxy-L-arabinose transferase-like glycosyltransferase